MFDSYNICFVCLSDRHELNKLFHNGIEYDVFAQIKYLIPELVFPDLTNPMYICSSCHGELRLFHVFKKKCIENYSRLTHYKLMLQKNYYTQDHDNQTEIVNYDEVEKQKSELLVELNIKEEQDDSLLLSTDERTSESEMIINDNEQLVEVSLLLSTEEHTSESKMINGNEQLHNESLSCTEEYTSESEMVINGNEQLHNESLLSCTEEYTSESEMIINGNEQLEVNKNLNSQESNKCSFMLVDEQIYVKDNIEIKEELDESKCSLNQELEFVKCESKPENLQDARPSLTSEDNSIDSNECDVNGTDYFQCSFCGIKFSEEKYLEKHLKAHLDKGVFECSFCKKKLCSITKLKKHEQFHTVTEVVTDYFQCTFCTIKFSEKKYLEKHIKTHFGIKEIYECPICDKKLSSKPNLKTHVRNHAEFKDVECSVCKRKYVQSAKNPECPTCKKKFAQICRLKHHRDAPVGSKYFKCSICNKYVSL